MVGGGPCLVPWFYEAPRDAYGRAHHMHLPRILAACGQITDVVDVRSPISPPLARGGRAHGQAIKSGGPAGSHPGPGPEWPLWPGRGRSAHLSCWRPVPRPQSTSPNESHLEAASPGVLVASSPGATGALGAVSANCASRVAAIILLPAMMRSVPRSKLNGPIKLHSEELGRRRNASAAAARRRRARYARVGG